MIAIECELQLWCDNPKCEHRLPPSERVGDDPFRFHGASPDGCYENAHQEGWLIEFFGGGESLTLCPHCSAAVAKS